MADINEVVVRPEYDFLRTNPHLGKNIMFLTFGGSHAYGTNVEGSDIDIRGCTLNQKDNLIGLQHFEQVLDNATDTTVYAFNKLVSLILNCNPNTIEMLGCRPDHYCYVSKMGQELLDNKKMFLSRRAKFSFGGYATAQLRRLENNLARFTLSDERKNTHIVNSCNSAMLTFNERYRVFDGGNLELYVDKSDRENIDYDIFVNADLKHYPLRDYNGVFNELQLIAKEYERLNGRNRKKSDAALNKHAMHLLRLYYMCFDILEREEIHTYRDVDHDILMAVRNGEFEDPDSGFSSAFFDMISECEKRLEYAAENTSLPDKPNYKQVEEFVMSVNERAILGQY